MSEIWLEYWASSPQFAPLRTESGVFTVKVSRTGLTIPIANKLDQDGKEAAVPEEMGHNLTNDVSTLNLKSNISCDRV